MKCVDAVALPAGRSRASDFAVLAKPRLNMLVVASSLAGYVMGGGELSNAPVASRNAPLPSFNSK